jgi:hypothetical protein
MQQQIAGVECLCLKARTVAWNEKPMADLIAQELNGTDGGEFPAKCWIFGISTLRKNKPNTIVPGRFLVIPEHTNNSVGQVHRKTAKHPAYLGVQRGERLQDEYVRGLLF